MYVNTQSELDAEIAAFPWHDSYVREAHIQCPCYTSPGNRSVVAPDSNWLLRMIICSQDEEFPGIEFTFEGVERLSLEARVDLKPRGTVANGVVEVFLTTVDATPIRAERLRIQRLGAEIWGPNTRYCEANPFDESGFLLHE